MRIQLIESVPRSPEKGPGAALCEQAMHQRLTASSDIDGLLQKLLRQSPHLLSSARSLLFLFECRSALVIVCSFSVRLCGLVSHIQLVGFLKCWFYRSHLCSLAFSRHSTRGFSPEIVTCDYPADSDCRVVVSYMTKTSAFILLLSNNYDLFWVSVAATVEIYNYCLAFSIDGAECAANLWLHIKTIANCVFVALFLVMDSYTCDD